MVNEAATKTSEASQGTTETVEATVATEPKPVEAQEGQSIKAEGEAKTEPVKAGSVESLPKAEVEKLLEQAKATVKGGYEGTIKKMREDLAKAQQERETVLAQIEQARQAEFLKSVEANGLDVNLAKLIVDRERKARETEQTLNQLAERLNVTKAELEQAAIGKKIADVTKEYGLSAEEAKELATAQNPTEMELMAVKLALRKANVAKKAPEKVAGETGDKSGLDFGKLTDREKLGLALSGKLK